MTLIRSALFLVWFALTSTAIALLALPTLAMNRRAVVFVSRNWSRVTLFGLKWIAGLDYEIRGTRPPRGTLIAAKHMSMWDTIALYLLIEDAIVVIKRELLFIPFYGWYVWKAGSIAIDRDGGAHALRRMVDAARAEIAKGHPIVIFPEGHRMAPGAPPEYKPGVAALYAQLGVPCVPVALNSGLFWTGPMGFLKKRGKVVVEFLEPISAGLKPRAFLNQLETRIEGATAGLIAEGRALLLDGRSATLPAGAVGKPGPGA